MRIRMLVSVAGVWTAAPGDVVDRPDAEAKRLIDRGYAVPVEESAVESAMLGQPETATQPAHRARRGR